MVNFQLDIQMIQKGNVCCKFLVSFLDVVLAVRLYRPRLREPCLCKTPRVSCWFRLFFRALAISNFAWRMYSGRRVRSPNSVRRQARADRPPEMSRVPPDRRAARLASRDQEAPI